MVFSRIRRNDLRGRYMEVLRRLGEALTDMTRVQASLTKNVIEKIRERGIKSAFPLPNRGLDHAALFCTRPKYVVL